MHISTLFLMCVLCSYAEYMCAKNIKNMCCKRKFYGNILLEERFANIFAKQNMD